MVSRLRSPYKSEQLAEDFYCYVWHGRGNNCGSCLFANALRGERAHVIVDPGHASNELREPCFDYLARAAMEEDGLEVDDVGLIINTHSHPDHCQANEVIVEKSHAWVTLSEEEDEYRSTLVDKQHSVSGRSSYLCSCAWVCYGSR